MRLAAFLDPVRELLAIPSTADRPAELHRALAFVLDFVGPGFTVERFERGGKPSALLYREPVRPRFRVILNGHLDVVPAPPQQFQPFLDGDRLYARGAHDMKVSALVLAQVFADLAGDSVEPIGLQLVTDEEVGGRDGTGYQLEQGVTGQFAVIGEQSGLRLVTESKGLLKVVLTGTGRTAHSAYPWLGSNALVALVRTVERILARYPTPTAEAWQTTVNVARIETDNHAFNQIPAHAAGWLDIRFPPEDSDLAGRPIGDIAGYLSGFCAPGVSVEVISVDQPHHADRGRAEITRLDRAARDQGYPGGFLRKHGAADGRYYSARGIDAVTFGIDGAGQHGPAEYADITSIVPYHRALTQFLRDPG
jgi:succinyl-diaminopimelate desuccinylase